MEVVSAVLNYRNGDRWEELVVRDELEAEIKKTVRECNVEVMSECIADAKELLRQVGQFNAITTQTVLQVGTLLFERRTVPVWKIYDETLEHLVAQHRE